jgi:hypothetical protein
MAHKSKLKVTSQNQATIDEYLMDLKIVKPTIRPNTLRNIKYLLRTLGDFLGEKPSYHQVTNPLLCINIFWRLLIIEEMQGKGFEL